MRDIQRQAIESLYEGLCSIVYRDEVEDPSTGVTTQVDKVIVENEPCRLSYDNSNRMMNDIADRTKQDVTLFIRPELKIPAGSKITVTQHNVTHEFKNSGVPMVHYSHQEVPLLFSDRYGRYYE